MPTHKWADIKRKRTPEQEAEHETRVAAEVAEAERASGAASHMVDGCTYSVTWSDEDQEFVGLCAQFPSLSWLDPQRDTALSGIVRLVADTLRDMGSADEAPPAPLS